VSYTNFPKNKPLKKIVGFIYTIWVLLWFVGFYLILFPVQFVFLQWDRGKKVAHKINVLWAHLVFTFGLLPIDIEYEFSPNPKETYVFVSNHFSYWDVATAYLIIPNFFAFVGKMSVKNVPLLGYMFVKLHIMVDRSAKQSRAISMVRSMKALQSGRSMMLFAEGGILTENPPELFHTFKDGAFTMAIQNQVPIVPITLHNNYKFIWHDVPLFFPTWLKAKVHKPIACKGLSEADTETLKAQVRKVLQEELNAFSKSENNAL
jgi:1-acyl-sn-glycerol-3-phosphate acyltransferase